MDQLHKPTFKQMRKIVWDQMKATKPFEMRRVLAGDPEAQTELEDRIKWTCAKLGIAYNSESVRKAVDCVLFLERAKPRRVA